MAIIVILTLPRILRRFGKWVVSGHATLQSQIKPTLSATVLPAKSDSDVMFCLQRYQSLLSR